MIKNMILSYIFLILFAATVCIAEDDSSGAISGRWITKNHGPMAGAQVLLFNKAVGPPPSSDKYLRVPDVTTTIDSDGKFSVLVAPGNYYLVMRKRGNEGTSGPPRDGDLQFYSRDKKGKAKFFPVRDGKETDIGTISDVAVFRKLQSKYEKGTAAIEGTVTDEAGMPVEGVRAFAYTSPEMAGKPQYASEVTGKDGSYFINVYKQGTYYLKVRSHIGGGQPEAGEFMGGYGEQTAPAIIKVQKGELRKGVDISTNKFPGRGKRD